MYAVCSFYRFLLIMGGGSCRYPSTSGEGVTFQYSSNGGITWTVLTSQRYYSSRQTLTVRGQLPSTAQTPSTRFRWLQTSNSGPGYDVWSIDDVYIGGGVGNNYFYETFEQSTEQLVNSEKWVSTGIALTSSNVCSSSSRVLVDNTTSTTPIQTAPININASGNYVLQFDLVMACGQSYSTPNPVRVEYNKVTSSSSSWTSLTTPCFPGTSTCDSNKGLYAQPNTFYSTAFKEWRRVVLVIPSQSL